MAWYSAPLEWGASAMMATSNAVGAVASTVMTPFVWASETRPVKWVSGNLTYGAGKALNMVGATDYGEFMKTTGAMTLGEHYVPEQERMPDRSKVSEEEWQAKLKEADRYREVAGVKGNVTRNTVFYTGAAADTAALLASFGTSKLAGALNKGATKLSARAGGVLATKMVSPFSRPLNWAGQAVLPTSPTEFANVELEKRGEAPMETMWDRLPGIKHIMGDEHYVNGGSFDDHPARLAALAKRAEELEKNKGLLPSQSQNTLAQSPAAQGTTAPVSNETIRVNQPYEPAQEPKGFFAKIGSLFAGLVDSVMSLFRSKKPEPVVIPEYAAAAPAARPASSDINITVPNVPNALGAQKGLV